MPFALIINPLTVTEMTQDVLVSNARGSTRPLLPSMSPLTPVGCTCTLAGVPVLPWASLNALVLETGQSQVMIPLPLPGYLCSDFSWNPRALQTGQQCCLSGLPSVVAILFLLPPSRQSSQGLSTHQSLSPHPSLWYILAL